MIQDNINSNPPKSFDELKVSLNEIFGESPEIGNRKYFDFSEPSERHFLRIEIGLDKTYKR